VCEKERTSYKKERKKSPHFSCPHFSMTKKEPVSVMVCVYECGCVRGREREGGRERERGRERDRKREKERERERQRESERGSERER